MTDRIYIQIDAPEHSGKTHLAILLAEYLKSIGTTVHLQKLYDEDTNKLNKPKEELEGRLKDVEVFISEMQTAKIFK